VHKLFVLDPVKWTLNMTAGVECLENYIMRNFLLVIFTKYQVTKSSRVK